MVRENPTITPEDVQKLLLHLKSNVLWSDQVSIARHGTYFDHHGSVPPDADEIVSLSHADQYRAALDANDVSSVQGAVHRYSNDLGLTVAPGSLDEKILGRVILRVFAEACEADAERARETRQRAEQRVAVPLPLGAVDDIKERTLIAEKNGTEKVQDKECRTEPATTIATTRPSAVQNLEALWILFTTDQVSNKKWGKGFARQSFGTMRLWRQLIGEHDRLRISQADAQDFRRVLTTLPGNYSKAKEWRDLTLREIASACVGKAIKPIAFSTCNRHFSVMTAFFDWARKNELILAEENPFVGLWLEADEDLDPMEGGSAARKMWEEGQLKRLFESPLFTGCKSEARRHKPGEIVFRDALYWTVLIAAYTGMRREEICQLRVRHILKEADARSGKDIWYADLKAPGLRLKGKESKRWVVINDDLIALGFISSRVTGRELDESLFPELKTSAAYDTYGDKLGQKFTRYRQYTGLYEPLLDIHSFRHTISTLLIRAGVPQAHAEELIGHKSEARRTTFAIYDKGATLGILKDAVDKINLPIDIDRLVSLAGG